VEVAPAALLPGLELVARGEQPPGAPVERMWLVCTNGKRDACCAQEGVPVARALAAARPHETWECSHLGGHRFAANVALVPHGLSFGRVGAADAVDLVERVEAGDLPLEHLRGRMALSPPAQAAVIAAREAGAATGLAPLDVRLEGAIATVDVLRFELSEEPLPPRPVSCGVEPEPLTTWRARAIAPA
jgi:hypothetical protein